MQETVEVKVFISCPGDVTPEKDQVINACNIVTKHLVQRDSKYRFCYQDFREIYAPLEKRAQDEINSRFSDYDIYIGILWMKFGTPTGIIDPNTNKEYGSGTFEEFSIARSRKEAGENIDIFLFFKDPIESDNVIEKKQLKLVQEFKREAQKLGWTNKFSSFSDATKFYDTMTLVLHKWVADQEKAESISKKNKFITKNNTSKLPADFLKKFINECTFPQNSINRTFYEYSTSKKIFSYFEKDENKLYLSDLVLEKKRIVVLGNPGCGKSTELNKLVQHFSSKDSPLIPVYKKLNTYVDESLEDVLPKEWNIIPVDICLLILDGLDEIQPQNFNTAIRKIKSFSDKNPEIRIVISCRTNFYQFPENDFKGTLSNFEVYLINDLDINSIKTFAVDKYQIDADEFISEAYKKDLHQLIIQPFFLEIILQEYKKENRLLKSKAELLDSYIEKRFISDQMHFNTTINLKSKKLEILKMLQRVALSMEYLGRNYIENEELLRLISSSEDLELIKHSTAFNCLTTDSNKWAFEHNNIQEFLAAKSLLSIDLEEIKKLVSFRDIIIKPSWVNSLIFYISIVNSEQLKDVLDWLVTIEPQILVKIEPDKLDQETRIRIFQDIFNDFKEKDLWIRSNKFSSKDLASFASSREAQNFLIHEIELDTNPHKAKLNAIYLLQDFSIDDIDETKILDSVIKFITENVNDPYIFHAATNTLISLSLLDDGTLTKLFSLFGKRKHQYIRSAFYKAISHLNISDRFLDYLAEGLNLKNSEEDRDDTNLLDESYLLKEAFSKVQNIQNIVSTIELILDIQNIDSNLYYHLPEIVQVLVNKAIDLYQNQNHVYVSMLDIYKNTEVRINDSYAKDISKFFLKTNKVVFAYESILTEERIDSYDKEILISHLITEEVINHTVTKYLDRDFTNKDIQNFYDNLKRSSHIKFEEFTLLKDILKNKKIPIVDHTEEVQKQQRKRSEENFKLYFDPDSIKNEIETFFEANLIEELTRQKLWSLDRSFYNEEQQSVHQVTFDLLADFTRNQGKINLESVLTFINNTHGIEDYLFLGLAKKIKNTPQFTPDKSEIESLQGWVNRILIDKDIAKAIKVSKDSVHNFTVNQTVDIAWFFILKYNLVISNGKLLDFTLFHNWKANGDSVSDFNFIEKQVGISEVKKRVQQNIENGIDFYALWESNAFYAIEKKIKSVYSKLLKDFADSAISIYSRNKVVIEFIRNIGTPTKLSDFIESIPEQELRSTVILELIKTPKNNAELKQYLLKVLKDYSSSTDDKIAVSQFLTQLSEDNGVEYYLLYLEKMANDIDFDSYNQTNYIKAIKQIKYLSKLIEIMEKSYLNIYNTSKQSGYDSLESNICDALYQLALVSENNLTAVKYALNNFIERNKGRIKNITEFYPMIDRMENQFYVTKSQNLTINDAIKEVDKILKLK